MDTIIFLLLFATWLAMFSHRRWPAVLLFAASLAATLLLFAAHATDSLPLSF